ncbi:hypothetical protein [Mesorhizobium sp. ES1-4]|uniref:hypothetical protein n=1 Tax=Mesorhizobium sp. ES1-4 TaxID=2876627 RepID=UPI001CCEFBC4|nr:hypothetical protein [Mesorhizobium sp. ES1-4]MBZ9799103.1 hypothetical protein [Mesorhizobium sp. ES1-4]
MTAKVDSAFDHIAPIRFDCLLLRDPERKVAWQESRCVCLKENNTSPMVKAASAQMGPSASVHTRNETVCRLLAMMREAKGRGAELVVLPEHTSRPFPAG